MNYACFASFFNTLTHPFVAQGLLTAFVISEGFTCIKANQNSTLLRRVSITLLCLLFTYALYAHVCVDTRYLFVMQNNHPAQAIHYRIASLWSHHETSLFIWLLILNVTTYILRLPSDAAQFRGRILALLNCLLGFYMLVEANPFAATPLVQLLEESQGLNPLLYDINMVWHPPLLYLGTTWLFTPYTLGLFLYRTHESAFIPLIQHQTKTAFGLLTLAIALGSFWAFTQLGWGGFWFWDPVETASLLPWLSALIVFHVPLLSFKKHSWLASVPFVAVMLSLWAVRSGMLVSVHSFSNDNTAFWLLGALTLFTWLLVFVAMKISPSSPLHSLSFSGIESISLSSHPIETPLTIILGRDPEIYKSAKKNTWSIANKLQIMCGINCKNPWASIFARITKAGLYLLTFTLFLLILGLFIPVLLDVSLAASFFNTVLLPIWIIIVILMTFAPYKGFHLSLSTTAGLLGFLLYLIFYSHLPFPYLLLGASGAVCASTMLPLVRTKTRVAFAHMGIGLCLIGLASHSDNAPEVTLTLTRGAPMIHNAYNITFKETFNTAEPFKATKYTRITIALTGTNHKLTLTPVRQFFHSSQLQRVKADFGLLNQRIVMITNIENLPDDTIAITFHEKSGLLWLVLGCVMIVFSLLIAQILTFSRSKYSSLS